MIAASGASRWLEELGERPWAVLGGGGLKGLAHIGAWQALEESGIRPLGIVGTSIGALVGAALAGGLGWRDLAPIAVSLKKEDIIRINRRAVWVNGVREPSLFRGEVLREYIDRVLPVKSWEDLSLPLQINAVNLETGKTEWFGTGARTDVTLADAVYASAALPVFYPPALIGDAYYVDGGVCDALSLTRASEMDATGLVTVDVGAGVQDDAVEVVRDGMVAVHHRVFSIMAGNRRREGIVAWTGQPMLLVRPQLDDYATFAFDHLKYFLEEGYRAARSELEAGPEEG